MNYFRANPGTLLIVAFQILLATGAVLSVIGNSWAANEIALYAFYVLVIGLAIQIGVVGREERKRAQTGNGSHSQSS